MLVLGEFAKEKRGIPAGEKQFVLANFALRIRKDIGKNLRGLHGAQIRAGKKKIRRNSKGGKSFGHGFGLLDAIFGEVAIRVSRALGIFAIDGDTVTNDI